MRASPRFLLIVFVAVLLCAGNAVADALTTLNDAGVFKRAQQDVATLDRAELDALSATVATCAAVSIGQRMQQFECERGIYLYWARYGRGRALDDYLTALSGLFAAFDNNPLGTTPQMNQTYRRASENLVTLTKDINARYRRLAR